MAHENNQQKNVAQSAPPAQKPVFKKPTFQQDREVAFQQATQARIETNKKLVESPNYTAVSTQTGEGIDLSYVSTAFDIGMRRLRDTAYRNPRLSFKQTWDLFSEGQELVMLIHNFNRRLYPKVGMRYKLPIRIRKQFELYKSRHEVKTALETPVQAAQNPKTDTTATDVPMAAVVSQPPVAVGE